MSCNTLQHGALFSVSACLITRHHTISANLWLVQTLQAPGARAPECPHGTIDPIESDQGVAPKNKELLNISDFNSVFIYKVWAVWGSLALLALPKGEMEFLRNVIIYRLDILLTVLLYDYFDHDMIMIFLIIFAPLVLSSTRCYLKMSKVTTYPLFARPARRSG